MLKQITIKNLYNFRDEITFDFDVKKDDFVLAHKYNDDYIANFSLIYGKNNVGKSNLFRIIKETQDFILGNKMVLQPFRPASEEKPSIFEIIFEKEFQEIRYGFEILIDSAEILDEWLFAKVKSPSSESISRRERTYFIRKEEYFHNSFLAKDRKSLNELKDTHLYLNYFNSINHEHEIINSLITQIKSLNFVDCMGRNSLDLNHDIITLLGNKKDNKLFTEFLRAADLDIVEVNVQELNYEELKFLEKMRAVYIDAKDEEELNSMSKKVMDEYSDVLPSLVHKNIIGRMSDVSVSEGYSIEFKHRSGANFGFNDLSSGTKQIINILASIVQSLKEETILIFDEIESGLHLDLIELLMILFKESTNVQKTNQFIITTHREELLDNQFISNDNIMFLKYDKENNAPYLEYLSEYKTRRDQKLSNRYKLNAFDTNPDISQSYNLKLSLEKIFTQEDGFE